MAVYNMVTNELRCWQVNLTALNLLYRQKASLVRRALSLAGGQGAGPYFLVLSNGQGELLFFSLT